METAVVVPHHCMPNIIKYDHSFDNGDWFYGFCGSLTHCLLISSDMPRILAKCNTGYICRDCAKVIWTKDIHDWAVRHYMPVYTQNYFRAIRDESKLNVLTEI